MLWDKCRTPRTRNVNKNNYLCLNKDINYWVPPSGGNALYTTTKTFLLRKPIKWLSDKGSHNSALDPPPGMITSDDFLGLFKRFDKEIYLKESILEDVFRGDAEEETEIWWRRRWQTPPPRRRLTYGPIEMYQLQLLLCWHNYKKILGIWRCGRSNILRTKTVPPPDRLDATVLMDYKEYRWNCYKNCTFQRHRIYDANL